MTMTMYKNIIRAAFLFATGIFMTACSSGDDNIADSRTIVTPDTKENTVTLTGTISAGSDITRAVDDTDGKTVSWNLGDEICVQYTDKDGNYATVKGKITEVVNSDTHNAKFTATLTNLAPNSTTNFIGLAYPYSNVTAGNNSVTDFAIKDGILAKQAGTIAGINDAKLDIAWTESEVGITIDWTKATATLNKDAELSNQVCICKFNIKDTDGTTDLNARMLEITTGTYTIPNYIVTPANEQSTFYVVLPPISGNLKIEASTCGTNGAMKLDSENKLKAMKSTDVGSYISIDPTVGTNQYQAYLCKNLTTGSPASTTAKICSHTSTKANLAKDKFYTKDLTTTIKENLTPIAVVSSVGEVSGYWDYFLALALEDATSGTVSVSSGETYATTFATNHPAKIAGTTYNNVAARGSNQPYDRVYDNIFDNHETGGSYTSKGTAFESWESSAKSGSALKGWRVPAVTDWRYIIQHFGGRSANLPKGIGDHNALYPKSLYSIEGDTELHYYQGGLSAFVTSINNACGNSSLQTNYYWSSSQLDAGQEAEKKQGTKIWRYNFADGAFQWNSGGELGDNSHIRLVLAY